MRFQLITGLKQVKNEASITINFLVLFVSMVSIELNYWTGSVNAPGQSITNELVAITDVYIFDYLRYKFWKSIIDAITNDTCERIHELLNTIHLIILKSQLAIFGRIRC